jgi:hypothetical protein
MPSFERCQGERFVISLSLKIIFPDFGFRKPEMTLRVVDLPAPLGPMSETISPFFYCN